MPVYLGTSHAYRSWNENHARGYVQRDEGLKSPSEELRRWRAGHATHEPATFSLEYQRLLHRTVALLAGEVNVRLHAVGTVCTHVHQLFSFRSPACTCGASRVCGPRCLARKFGERFIVRSKQKMGQQLAKLEKTVGRPWFSRDWDLTPVRGQDHFAYLMTIYLPDHERVQGGMFHRYS